MTATPAEAIDLSADLEKALDEEAQLLAMLSHKRAEVATLRDDLSHKRGEVTTLRTLITRLRALERGKTDALPLAPDHESEHKHESS